jgi:hypothetical protein
MAGTVFAWARAFVVGAVVTFSAAACSPPSYAAAGAAAEATRRSDIEVLRRDYVQASPAFTTEARERALRYLESLEPRVDTLSRAQYLISLLRVVAFADNGHDVLDGGADAWFPSARLPIRLLWLADGWVVARAAPEYADLVGGRVQRIEGRTPDEMLDALRPIWGGVDVARRWNALWIVEGAGLLHALGVARSTDGLDVVVTGRDGAEISRHIPFVSYSSLPPGQRLHRLWSPEPWPREAELRWKAAAPDRTPFALTDAALPFRALALPTLDSVYLQLRAHHDDGDAKIADVMRATDALIETHRPTNLIVDLRFDTGGNIDLTREWQRTLPARVPGTTYVLVGPYTFSAGIVAAAALKHDGGARVRIVGEAPGDRLVFWSEGRPVCLPHSRYCVRVNTGQWDLEHGCAGRAGCYGDRYDATIGDLTVDLPAPLTVESWLAGRDPAMDAIGAQLMMPASQSVPGLADAAGPGTPAPPAGGHSARPRSTARPRPP